MTLGEAFNKFRSEVEIAKTTRDNVSDQEKKVREFFQKTWPGCEVFLTGSYGRSTKINPLSDVDIFIARPDPFAEISKIPHDPAKMVQNLYALVQQNFPGASIRPQRRSVGITFQVASQVRMDLVPAYRKKDGGYYLADTEKSKWVFTNPKKQLEFTKECDRNCRQMAVPLVKMVKVWNREHQVGIKSYHLETMVLRLLKTKPTSYPEGARLVFEGIAKAIMKSCGDPGDSGTGLDEYLDDGTREKIRDQAAKASETMKKAIEDENSGKNGEAIVICWRLFGSAFPKE